MTDRINHIMHPVSEIAFIGFGLLSVVSSRLLLADSTIPAPQQFALQWFLLPLLGALAASVCAMLMNPRPEARKTVLARCICGAVAGSAIPKVVSMFHPALRELTLDPAIIFLAGFAVGGFVYIVCRSAIEKIYGRADDIGEQIANKVGQEVSRVTVTTTKVTNDTQSTQQ